MSAPKTLVVGAALAAYGAVAVARPGGLGVVPPCPLRSLTGLDCPLCGATRATRELVLRQDLAAALDLNALYVVAVAIAAVAVVTRLLTRRPPSWLTHRRAPLALAAAAIAFGIVRNLPLEPFRYLGT